jgi:site-specific recombinase XerD
MVNLPSLQPTVSVYTRHTSKCPFKKNRFSRQCTCPKWLYIINDGQPRRISAKTRDGRTADERMETEQNRLRATPEEVAKKAADLTVVKALDKWVGSFKEPWSESTTAKYQAFIGKVTRWAEDNEIVLLKDMTPDRVETWRSEWGLGDELPPNASHPGGRPRRKDDKMGPTTQSLFQGYLKRFCNWAHTRDHFSKNPTALLESIRPGDKRTMPLSLEQFDELIVAAEKYDSYRFRAQDRFGIELKAIFLVQRWVGLRILDVLVLPRRALVGNVLRLKTIKTGAPVVADLPAHVVAALKAIPSRPGTHEDYFFWNKSCKHSTLQKHWITRIRTLRRQLSFVDEEGQPMVFHSHMLRDTFAVRLILAGVPTEKVSRLLTHKSVAVTERHYIRWIEEMKTQLRDIHIEAMKKQGAEFAA